MCNPDKNRIFWEARRNQKELNITLEYKLIQVDIGVHPPFPTGSTIF
jgi:hypothetical protein